AAMPSSQKSRAQFASSEGNSKRVLEFREFRPWHSRRQTAVRQTDAPTMAALCVPGRRSLRPRGDGKTMSFLQRFLKNTYRDGHTPKDQSSFRDLTKDQLEAHLNIKRYGNFVLTEAVRPSYDLQIV